MGDDAIAAYLRDLERALARAGRPTQPLVDEAAAHLSEDAARIAAAEGCGDAEAARRAVARFGAVGDVIRSVRKNTPLPAARVARIATVLLLAGLAWDLYVFFRFHDFDWPDADALWLAFVVELALVSVALWRALARGRAPAWLSPVLAAQAAVGLALYAMEASVTFRIAPTWTNVSIYHVMLVLSPTPLWMFVQGAAGWRALSLSRRGSTSAS